MALCFVEKINLSRTWTEQAERGAPSREGRCWSTRPVAWEVVGIFKCSGWVRMRVRSFISYRFDHYQPWSVQRQPWLEHLPELPDLAQGYCGWQECHNTVDFHPLQMGRGSTASDRGVRHDERQTVAQPWAAATSFVVCV